MDQHGWLFLPIRGWHLLIFYIFLYTICGISSVMIQYCNALFFAMKKIAATLLFLLLLTGMAWAWLSLSGTGKKLKSLYVPKKAAHFIISENSFKKLQTRAVEAKSFIQRNNYNNRICLLIDMSIPSNQNRFFVYDLKRDTVQNAGLVTHGRCNKNGWKGENMEILLAAAALPWANTKLETFITVSSV
jgi:hypothetical protein